MRRWGDTEAGLKQEEDTSQNLEDKTGKSTPPPHAIKS